MTPQTDSKLPEIRFKGFTGVWVEKTLGDIIDLGSGRDYKHLSPGDIPVYGTGGYMLSVNEALSTSRDAVGIGRKGTIDKPYILKAPFWTVDTLFYAIPKAENHLDFVYCIFQQIDWKQKDESTGVPSLSKVVINGVDVLLTNPTEQQKIGKYFRELDGLIDLHQRKHDKLLALKKAMLQKMFPQPDATTPEIRFKGFSGDWVEKKLHSCADRYDNLRVPITASNRIAGNTPYYGANGIQDYVEGYTHEGEFILVAEDGANDLKNYPVQYVSGKVWVNNHAHVLQGKEGLTETRFLKYAFSQINIEVFLVGGGRSKLNAETMMQIEFRVPTAISEQQKIGNYFRTLDELISKHATQLQKLQQIKSACLEKMFV